MQKKAEHKQKSFRFPKLYQWKQIFFVSNKNEKRFLIIFLALGISSFCFLLTNFYVKNTEIAPAFGGTHIEGVIGQPRFINPIYTGSNDVDRDLIELLFSGLMKYDSNGNIISDIAEKSQINEQNNIYEFYLKDNVFWSDGEKFTVDDIVFTIKTIQNPDYKSPLRANWIGVEMEKVSDKIIRFELEKPFAGFMERLTLKIAPKHIWENISPENFALSPYNLNPISCGIYELEELVQEEKTGVVKSLVLKSNSDYFAEKSNLKNIVFLFFENQDNLIQAAKQKKITGFSLSSLEKYNEIKNDFLNYDFTLPRYFAVFFNSDKSIPLESEDLEGRKILANKDIRQAINYATDKNEIIEKVFLGKAKIIDSPILPEIFNFNASDEIYDYNLEKAEEILEQQGYIKKENGIREKTIEKTPSFQFSMRLDSGSKNSEVTELQKCLAKDSEVYPDGEISGYFGTKTKAAVIKFQEKFADDILYPNNLKKGTGTVGKSTRKKLNEICFETGIEITPLKFSLITVENPFLEQTAEILKQQWEKAGIEIEIQTYPISELQYDIIKQRNYEMFLFGEVLGIIPDPYVFWHSLQKKDPGLNLALYENKDSDKLLEQARVSIDEEERKNLLEEFQNILIQDAPCVFLYSPDYLYFVSKKIKGVNSKIIVDPSKRFNNIEDWHIKTKRKWK